MSYLIYNTFHIPPEPGERIFEKPDGKWIGVPIQHFRNRLRFPLSQFIKDVLSMAGCGLGQLAPNSFVLLSAFLAHCHEKNIMPTVAYFFYTFKFVKSREQGIYQFSRQDGRPVLMKTATSNKGWHSKWVFICDPDIAQLPRWRILKSHDIKEYKPVPSNVVEYNEFLQPLAGQPWDQELFIDQQ